MQLSINSILVLGLGRIGSLIATLLYETGFSVTGADIKFLDEYPFSLKKLDVNDHEEIIQTIQGFDAVVSCLPYTHNLSIARLAQTHGVHYFDLTEDVATTKAIIEISKSSKSAMVPQCGLAPGFIAIVGASLANKLEKTRSIKLRVGALPRHPIGLLSYAFNWSPEGVVNEYLNDCQVIEDGQTKWVSPLEWLEKIVINGNQLEAFTTSGGLGTMCETYKGKVDNLDYKSIRYPGHASLMNFFFHELLLREDRDKAGEILVNAKPPVSDDVVYIHATAEGWQGGILVREEFVNAYYPIDISGQRWRAISWTTAASTCAVIELVSNGSLPCKGFIKQEDVPFEAFMNTRNGRLYTKQLHGRRPNKA